MNSDDLVFTIQALSPAQVRRQVEEVEAYLHHRAPLVRAEAAHALDRARVRSVAVRRALESERDTLVLTSLCEAVLAVDDQDAIRSLKKLCGHESWLVRKHACWAVGELAEVGARSFLHRALQTEKSRRVRATILMSLFKWGDDPILDELLSHLKSRDYIVRCIVAFGLELVRRRSGRPKVLAALRAALKCEPTVAAREALEGALAAWRPR